MKDVILISRNRVILIGRVSNLFFKSKVNLFQLIFVVVPNILRRTPLQLTYVTYLSMTLKFNGSHLSYFPLSGESQFCSFLFFFYTCILYLPIFMLRRVGGLDCHARVFCNIALGPILFLVQTIVIFDTY